MKLEQGGCGGGCILVWVNSERGGGGALLSIAATQTHELFLPLHAAMPLFTTAATGNQNAVRYKHATFAT